MNTTIAGIPCQITFEVHGRFVPARVNAPPEFCHEAEYPEIDWTVCDRRGRPAPWLATKLTDADRERIETEILESA
jgi:hypothetical protein